MASPGATPPALLEATRNSTATWQDDLQALFEHAKDRFPDVVWELSDDDDVQGDRVEEVWGHKGAHCNVETCVDWIMRDGEAGCAPQPPTIPGRNAFRHSTLFERIERRTAFKGTSFIPLNLLACFNSRHRTSH